MRLRFDSIIDEVNQLILLVIKQVFKLATLTVQNVNKPFRECLDMYKSRSPSNQLASSFFVHDGSEPTLSGDATPVLQSPQYRNTYFPVTNQRPDLSIGPRDSGDFCYCLPFSSV